MDRTLGVSKRDPDSSHLALENKVPSEVFSCRDFWKFGDPTNFHDSDVKKFLKKA